MPDYSSPQPLGGHATETTIDQANIAMRAMPWYQDLLKSMGQNPNSVKLNHQQSDQVLQQARAHGFNIDTGDMHVDESGNIDKKGHALRNTLIVAGLAAATIATMGAAGAFAGAAGVGAGAGAGAGAAGTAAGLGGVEAGALAGLGSAALPGAMTALPALAGTGAAIGAGTAATAGTGILGTAGKIASQGKGVGGYLDTAGSVADALGTLSAGRAAGRVDEANLNRGANQDATSRYLATLQGHRDALAAPETRAHNSVKGDILANAQDAQIHLPSTIPQTTISGGLRPSMFSDNTRQLGRDMSAKALSGEQSNEDTIAPPPMLEAPQAGRTDSILNTASILGSLASTIPYGRKKKAVVA